MAESIYTVQRLTYCNYSEPGRRRDFCASVCGLVLNRYVKIKGGMEK